MKRQYNFRQLALMAIALASSVTGFANGGGPTIIVRVNPWHQFVLPLHDTLPPIKTAPQVKKDSTSSVSTIKEVPKSKKQAAPVAIPVTLNVKPIKIIKPKIIKPVIKIN